MLNYDDLINAVAADDFEERPVDIETFATSKDYLGLPPLSHYQYILIKASTQIYKRETLHELYGFEEGEKRWRQTYNEVIFKLGKGSGKDFCSTVACAYIVYLLLCLKDPAAYYGKPPGDTFDIINVAINAAQANNVFFKGLTSRIEKCKWFEGRYEKRAGVIEFDKSINLYSGHSEREAFEGYNTIFVVLDEISGFAMESTSGNEQAKTAQAIYNMYKDSVDSRFPEYGKLVLLSFPRYQGCFISKRYDDVVAEKEVIKRTHTFKLDPDLSDGLEDNELTIEWDEDRIVSYKYPRTFALCRPSWEVNPTKNIEQYAYSFMKDIINALAKFACMPPKAIDAFFKDKAKVAMAFSGRNGVEEDGSINELWEPDLEKLYFIHVDLARKHDHCALALSHVESWTKRKIGPDVEDILPVIMVDLVRWWTPTKDKNVDFTDVREFILMLSRMGLRLRLVTFDRWESADMIEYLNSVGIKSERLSVAKKHYTDFASVVHDERLLGPDIELLRDELLQLRIMDNDKVDHPRKGSKDLSDAVCGSVFDAVALTPRVVDVEIEVSTLTSIRPEENVMEQNPDRPGNVIKPPKREMPADIQQYLMDLTFVGS